MLEFKPVELSDREWAERLLAEENSKSCEYNFANLFIWRNHYKTELAEKDGSLFIRNLIDGEYQYGFPAGKADKTAAIDEILATAAGTRFAIVWLTREQRQWLEEAYPGRFEARLDRDICEYIYNSDDLINLAGRKYHGKRNHIAQYMRACGEHAQYYDMTSADIPECKDAYTRWLEEHEGEDDYSDEKKALYAALDNFEALGLKGGVIKCQEGVCAFSAGRQISDDTFDVLIEKALGGHDAVYAVINNLFAKANCAEVQYINREDDMGLEGLRKAKESYHPAFLLEKYSVRLH